MRADVIVIGSGPGGALAAAELVEAGRDVLILEEGPPPGDDPPPRFGRREMEERYRGGGITPALGPVPVAYAEGRCVGGGSAVNSRLYHRTPEDTIERWQRANTIQAFTPGDLAPHFDALERELGVAPHPQGGDPVSHRLRDGAAAMGWSSVEVPRWTVRNALARATAAGARIEVDTRVTRVRRAGDSWVVEDRRGRARSAAMVVLACGAVQTPYLLRRSGIRTNVGNSLALHPTAKLVARFPERVQVEGEPVGVHQVREFAPEFTFGCSVSGPSHLALALLDHRDALREVPQQSERAAIYYVMTPAGRGTVRVLPGFDDPLVRYDVGPHTLERLARGLGKLAECLFAAGAEAVWPGVAGAPALRGPDDIARVPAELDRRASLMSVHLMASCPMGEDRRITAMDSFGRVHDAPGLFVSDASMLPGQAGVNPQGTLLAIARRNVRHWIQGG